MPKIRVKLGKGVTHFYDMVTRTSVFPGEVKQVEFKNSSVKAALSLGTLVRVPISEEEFKKEQTISEIEKDPLYKKTVKEILEEFAYMEEEDLARVKKLNKAEMLAELRKLEENYEEVE